MIFFRKKLNKNAETEVDKLLAASVPSWQKSSWEFIREVLKVVIISIAIILPIRYFLIQPYYVKGASMEPNFYDHDYLIIDEISYRFREPERGEVIVFRFPVDTSQFFIKRVIGLPEETVKISGGKIYIYNKENPQGFELPESYLNGVTTEMPGGNGKPYEVVLDEDEYFVLGDNRKNSMDSRIFGPLERKFIIGRTWLRGWPFDRAESFSAPMYEASTKQ